MHSDLLLNSGADVLQRHAGWVSPFTAKQRWHRWHAFSRVRHASRPEQYQHLQLWRAQRYVNVCTTEATLMPYTLGGLGAPASCQMALHMGPAPLCVAPQHDSSWF